MPNMRSTDVMPALSAACAYFASIFALGFVVGAVRTIALEGVLGAFFATALEVPVMLAAAWMMCARIVRMFAIKPHLADRMVMGCGAFVLLMAAEFTLGAYGFGRPLSRQLEALREPGPALGLAAQLLFAAVPGLQLRPRS
jgi:hypothetical protein